MLCTGTYHTHREMVVINSKRLDDNVTMKRITANPGRKPMAVQINFPIETAI